MIDNTGKLRIAMDYQNRETCVITIQFEIVVCNRSSVALLDCSFSLLHFSMMA